MKTNTNFVFKKKAIIIAILGQKSLYWELNKVLSSGMYNCNFKTINYNLGHNILRFFDVLPNFPFTTSETNGDY